jgi:hypothetical protein
METQAKILQTQSPNQQSVQAHPASEPIIEISCDLLLLYASDDISWATKLAKRLQGAQFGIRDLRVSLADWKSSRATNFWNAISKSLQCQSHLAIIVSRIMLRDEWTAVQQIVKSLIESAPAEGRVVSILKDNVTMPPPLRLCEWFDFRAERDFEESVSDLITFLNLSPASNSEMEVSAEGRGTSQGSAMRSDPGGGMYSFGVSPAKERLLSNLFPVAELPKLIFSAETQLMTETELTEICPGAEHLPFLLKSSRLFTIEPLSRDSAFAPAVSDWDTRKQENFSHWSFGRGHAGCTAKLLNNAFRHHAWKRGLRWDSCTDQYYFPRARPKSVWWEVSEQTIAREVTAPRMGSIELENHTSAEVQYGWKHQSLRADFVQLQGNLFLRLEPSWLLTELDGKTAATIQPVGPVFSGIPQQQRNGQILRSLRFWSAIFAKGHHEIRMGAGHSLVRIKLTPLSGFTQFGIPSDQMDYDQLILTEMEDDLLMPALGLLGQGNTFRHEEDLSS